MKICTKLWPAFLILTKVLKKILNYTQKSIIKNYSLVQNILNEVIYMRKFHLSPNLKTFGITVSKFSYLYSNLFKNIQGAKNNP